MCIDFEYELNWKLKCDRCGKKPAVSLLDPFTGGDPSDEYSSLCETCGIEVYGESVVCEWAGTESYLKKYPDQIAVWR